MSSRVGSSLLRAHGVPLLIARDLTDYVALATKAVHAPWLRAVFAQKRKVGDLFDHSKSTLHFERAILNLWEVAHAGMNRPKVKGTRGRRASRLPHIIVA